MNSVSKKLFSYSLSKLFLFPKDSEIIFIESRELEYVQKGRESLETRISEHARWWIGSRGAQGPRWHVDYVLILFPFFHPLIFVDHERHSVNKQIILR